jgi:hypothetical protein
MDNAIILIAGVGMEIPHRMKVKLGSNEFEAEGKPELVKKQWEEFKVMVAQLASKQTAETPVVPPTPGVQKPVIHSKLPKALLDRVFRQGEPLSLMDTPKTDNAEADALLVLVYGHTEMIGKPDVTAAMLAKSASKTGINVYRIGRTISAREAYIRSSGLKKGTRYSLNNRGIAEAEKLIKAMVE